LGEERRHFEQLQARVEERTKRDLKISNLKSAEEAERKHLEQLAQQHSNVNNDDIEMVLGDADKTFAVLPANVASVALFNNPSLAKQVPSMSVLRARLATYVSNNQSLESTVKALRSKSRELETKYRRIIQLCVSVPEQKVDDLLDSLYTAVESESGEVELGRVKDFLQRVEAC
jgi:regulatory protein SWI6